MICKEGGGEGSAYQIHPSCGYLRAQTHRHATIESSIQAKLSNAFSSDHENVCHDSGSRPLTAIFVTYGTGDLELSSHVGFSHAQDLEANGENTSLGRYPNTHIHRLLKQIESPHDDYTTDIHYLALTSPVVRQAVRLKIVA